MKIRIQDGKQNDYLSRMYFEPLRLYCMDRGMDIGYAPLEENLKDCVVILHGDTASPERIRRVKEDNCKLVLADINDSSYLSSSYIHSPEQHLADLIFKVSGVPKQNEVDEVNLDRNFQIKVSREKYLPDPQWAEFSLLRHKIRPLPYVLWSPLVGPNAPVVPQKDRSGKVLIRGGNHFWRVILFFRLMQEGLLDENSEFHTAAYFSDSMEKRFQYCDTCKAERREHGVSLFNAVTTPVRRAECTNPVTGWELPGEFFGGPMFGRHEHGLWNNRCPHSFYFLAKEFERLRGPLDHGFLQRAFNGDMRPKAAFVHDLSRASYAGDAKWLNTINIPPRFWEAASVGTPSFLLSRTQDQDYWPPIHAETDYLTYSEEMTFGPNSIDIYESGWWDGMSKSVKALYEDKIRGTEYAVSNALLEYMWQSIEEIL